MLNYQNKNGKLYIKNGLKDLVSSKKVNLRLASSVLIAVMLFSGCSKKMDCDVQNRHFHIYNKDGIETLFDSEKEYKNDYKWTKETVEYSDELNDEIKFLEKNNLVHISNNLEYLVDYMVRNPEHIEYEYSYEAQEIDHYIGMNGIAYTPTTVVTKVGVDGKPEMTTIINTPVYKTVIKTDFTTDESVSQKTGKVRNAQVKYYSYKIVTKDNGEKVIEKSGLTDNILDLRDEYPYFNPNGFTNVVYTEFTIDNNSVLSK